MKKSRDTTRGSAGSPQLKASLTSACLPRMLINEYCVQPKNQSRNPVSASTQSSRTLNRKRYLCQLGSCAAHHVDVHHVRLRPERSQTGPFQRRPPPRELVETLVPLARMNLDLQLADGQIALSVRVDERRERVKLAAFNVNLEDVDERVI